MPLILLAVLLVAMPQEPASQPASGDTGDLRGVIERIAGGDAVEAADATDELIDRLTNPLVAALEAADQRPIEEQYRIHMALARLSATVRVRLHRASLAAADRATFDSFAQRYPELLMRLFDDDQEVRLAAIDQLPRDPASGAGLLLAAKLMDPSADVCAEALRLARDFDDPRLTAGLIRFVEKANQLLRARSIIGGQADLQIVITEFIKQAIAAVDSPAPEDGVPIIVEALRVHGRGMYRAILEPGVVLNTLGRLGDERAAPAVLEFIDDNEIFRARPLGAGRVALQTVGDAALLCLLRIYGLDPHQVGISHVELEGDFGGFFEDAVRQQAHRRFKAWHAANALKPHAQREALTSQPAIP